MITISPKAFFFDFDGVICDTEKAHMFATMKVVERFGIQFSEQYYFEKLFGFSDVGLFEHLFPLNQVDLSQETLKKLIEQKNHVFMDIIKDQKISIDGVKDLIDRLHKNAIPMCVVSGALKVEVEACLKIENLSPYFRFLVCADMVKKSKPDPESYDTAFDKMVKIIPNLRHEDCWVLEDSPTGISSANGAHLNVIGITNTTQKENLGLSDYIVESYSDITLNP